MFLETLTRAPPYTSARRVTSSTPRRGGAGVQQCSTKPQGRRGLRRSGKFRSSAGGRDQPRRTGAGSAGREGGGVRGARTPVGGSERTWGSRALRKGRMAGKQAVARPQRGPERLQPAPSPRGERGNEHFPSSLIPHHPLIPSAGPGLTFSAAARTPLFSPPPPASVSHPGCCACSPCARRCRCGRGGRRRGRGRDPGRAGRRGPY